MIDFPPMPTYTIQKMKIDEILSVTPKYLNCDGNNSIQYISDNFKILKTICNQTFCQKSLRDIVRNEIEDLYRDCSKPNWDCYGALPVSRQAVDNSIKFISNIRSIKTQPSISPMPSSDISFTWKNNNKLFTIEFTKSNEILYALVELDNDKSASGSFSYNDMSVKTIYSYLESVIDA